MITLNNKVVLIDFGIARTYKESQEGDTVILGSMGYIAPEQLLNNQSNAKTDIYSLGATMFFMLTGKSITLPTEIMYEENYPKHVAKSLVKIVQKASAAEHVKRYNNVKMIISDLNDIILHSENDKTILMNSYDSSTKATKTVLTSSKKYSKRFKLGMILSITCVIALLFLLISLAGNKALDKKVIEAPTVSKISDETAPKETKPAVKPVTEEVIKKVDEKAIEELEDKLREELKKAEEKERKEAKRAEEKTKGNKKND
jgi:serine/threonine protein kinase